MYNSITTIMWFSYILKIFHTSNFYCNNNWSNCLYNIEKCNGIKSKYKNILFN